ncbi:hypothetical protein BB559_006474 [Furculomyces boomerangus]|uniref:Uncharacterized protein n=1 Tax=Furculomyces boomerangus TaxID=61424 RepID=A0A2T9Y2R7_9FUNG|nr:hypothetical protein BB559_006474 [Furculomyces boomerangus]
MVRLGAAGVGYGEKFNNVENIENNSIEILSNNDILTILNIENKNSIEYTNEIINEIDQIIAEKETHMNIDINSVIETDEMTETSHKINNENNPMDFFNAVNFKEEFDFDSDEENNSEDNIDTIDND